MDMRDAAPGGFLVLSWPSGTSGSGMEAWPEAAGLLAKSGAVLGVTLFCKIQPCNLISFFTVVSLKWLKCRKKGANCLTLWAQRLINWNYLLIKAVQMNVFKYPPFITEW